MGAFIKKVGIEGHGSRNLLFFLLLYIVGSPFLDPYPSLEVFAHLSLTVALFVAVYTVQKHQKRRSIAIVLLFALLLLYWLGIYDVIRFSRLGSYLLFVVYFSLLMYSYIMQLARFQKVTVNVLYATLCLYLIIGLFWGSLYTLLNELSPGAYSGTLLDNMQGDPLHIFNYFSMVTLTTLGYGDITPQNPGAGALCQMEAIVGQFFTAVIVAWLVGSIITEKEAKILESEIEE
jgi:voltage-gated potassium channel